MIKGKNNKEFDIQDIREYSKLSAKEKFARLKAMSQFLDKITPRKSKKIWKKLQEKGY